MRHTIHRLIIVRSAVWLDMVTIVTTVVNEVVQRMALSGTFSVGSTRDRPLEKKSALSRLSKGQRSFRTLTVIRHTQTHKDDAKSPPSWKSPP